MALLNKKINKLLDINNLCNKKLNKKLKNINKDKSHEIYSEISYIIKTQLDIELFLKKKDTYDKSNIIFLLKKLTLTLLHTRILIYENEILNDELLGYRFEKMSIKNN